MTAAPTDIRARAAEHRLTITWADGHVSDFPYHYLRCQCGCAMCVDERTGQRILDPASVAATIDISAMSLTGQYAIKITWSDGHDTGLYSWAYLQRLCPCAACGGPKAFDRRISPH